MIFKKIIVAALAMALLAGGSSDADADGSIGQEAPALVVTDLKGHAFDLHALRGKTVIVTFWASWCPPCLEEKPMLSTFYRRYHDKGVEMIALSVDRPHDKDAVQKIAATASYPVALSSDATVNDFDNPDSLPVTYIIDTKGSVHAIFSDAPATKESLFKAVFH